MREIWIHNLEYVKERYERKIRRFADKIDKIELTLFY